MPTYDYECRACGHRWELFQSITAKPVKRCPACSRSQAKRLIGAGAGLIFKGSGFYLTDYRSEGYKQAAKAEKESVSGGEGKAKESKTAASAGEAKKAKKNDSAASE